jgi:hypothetical protein
MGEPRLSAIVTAALQLKIEVDENRFESRREIQRRRHAAGEVAGGVRGRFSGPPHGFFEGRLYGPEKVDPSLPPTFATISAQYNHPSSPGTRQGRALAESAPAAV